MRLDFGILANGWPVAGFYDPSDPRRVIGGFLTADVGACQATIRRFLDGIEQVRAGRVTEWRSTGDAFSVVITPAGCHLRQYDPPPGEGFLGDCHTSHDELAEILRAWGAHVAAGRRPTTSRDA